MILYIYSFVNKLKSDLRDPLFEGAAKHGYRTIVFGDLEDLTKINKTDVLIIWNRHLKQDAIALKFERSGATVLCMENPYIRNKGYYSFGYGYTNNMQCSPQCKDSGERFKSFDREIKPWRSTVNDHTKHILVCTQSKRFNQQGLGFKHFKQPAFWDARVLCNIRQRSDRHIIYRQHPNGYDIKTKDISFYITNFSISRPNKVARPIVDDLKDAWATIVYGSNAGTDSLLEGIPAFVCGPSVYMQNACGEGLMGLNQPFMSNNREQLFNRLAWAQFHTNEIGSGFAFDILLNDTQRQ